MGQLRETTWRQQATNLSHQFRPQPGYGSVYLSPPQLFIGLVTPAEADRSDSRAGLRMFFSGLSCCPEGMNQLVLNVLQNHGGQSVLAVAVSVHAGRVWKCVWLPLSARSLTQDLGNLLFSVQYRSCPSRFFPPYVIKTLQHKSVCFCSAAAIIPLCLPSVELACFVIVTMEKQPSAFMPLLLLLPPFDYVNKNGGRSRTKTIVASEKNWKGPLLLHPPPPPPPFFLLSLFLFFSQTRPHPILMGEMCCEWALIWTKCKTVCFCACTARTRSFTTFSASHK